MNLKKQIDLLCGKDNGYWSQRMHSELDFLQELLLVRQDLSAIILQNVLDWLKEQKQESGTLTKSHVLEAEAKLSAYGKQAKEYRLHMVSHAHIDMNWKWGFDETVGVTIDTFRTMLRLLKEYPNFIFTQSQAAVYEIVEKYAPDLLPAIRRYVKEGRWEVIASTWVEADKNLSSGESMARHILYTKQYLSDLLDLDPDTLEVDFEPDTFGHSAHVPEILGQGGVKYYYYCRGNDREEACRWRAPSGHEVLALREPQWYLTQEMDPHMAYHVPGFCTKHNTRDALRFYGVGDHGGGPSRRDIEMIMDMQTWPLLPEIRFSTLHAFFHALEKSWDSLPVVEREFNFIFTGCYTAQSRIKRANRHCEDHLYDCEALCAMAQMAGCDMNGLPSFTPAWKNTMFNQFHDILPGSCVRETGEHALGLAQQTNAIALANANRALNALGAVIATDAFCSQFDPMARGEGAGSGFGASTASSMERAFTATRFQVSSMSNGGGGVRAYTLFNPTQYDRKELVELTIWDWNEPLEATKLCTAEGTDVSFEVERKNNPYWFHQFSKIVFKAEVPAFGYRNYYVMAQDKPADRVPFRNGDRVHRITDEPVILENDLVSIRFKRETMEILSMTDKATGTELVKAPSASFRLIEEQDSMPYSAWTVGQSGKSENLNQSCFVRFLDEGKDSLHQWICFEIKFRNSTIQARYVLAENAKHLNISLEVDWREKGEPEGATPQLQFYVPFAYEANRARYDIPGGFYDRPALGHDVPAIGYAAPLPLEENHPAIVMTSDCKYGYRVFEGAITVDLIRGSHRPERVPDQGVHQIEIGLGIVDTCHWTELNRFATIFAHPIYCYSNTIHSGVLPQSGQLLQVGGDIHVLALKTAEDEDGFVLRLAQAGDSSNVVVKLANMSRVQVTDILERPVESLQIQDDSVQIPIPGKSIRTIKLS